ncbi:MAG TPA: NADH-quinone oxidoreductase subunit N [Bacteroidota bacterium]|nr:NADH-quinone oxidoreductase subunit N [Bacteroidota bacterium]
MFEEFFKSSDLIGASPILVLSLCSLIALVVNAAVKNSAKLIFGISAIGLLASAACAIYLFPSNSTAFVTMVLVGGYASIFDLLFLSAAMLTLMLSYPYLEKEEYHYGEYYVLMLFATIGMMMMGSAADLITIFIGLEIMSVSFYVLAGFIRVRQTANEAALKYFLLGAFATGFLLYGIALIYGTTGTTNLFSIASIFPMAFSSQPVVAIGFGLMLIGFAFKVAAAPFHMWVPDVYEGSPTPVTGFMSTGGKAGAFAALLLSFSLPMSLHDPRFVTVIAVLAAASMIIGNLLGVAQTNIKRMLAYSSVAHAGYMLVGIASGASIGNQGVLFYLISYALTNLGAFGVVSVFEKENGRNLLNEDFAGLASRRPVLAALLAMFMFSLTGLPPFAGFVGKYLLFSSAVGAQLTWLAILGVMTSLFSAYYYLRIVVLMYFRDPVSSETIELPKTAMFSLALSGLGILLIGIVPSLVLNAMRSIF